MGALCSLKSLELSVDLVVEHLHDAVELIPSDLAVTVEVDLAEGVSDLQVGGSLVRRHVHVDKVGQFVQVDVAIAVGIDVLEGQGGPLGGALDEIEDLALGDSTVAVAVDNLEEGVELRIEDCLALHAGGGLELEL